MKVCPHCAEELPDEATRCSNCHKDPAEVPAWAVPSRPDESQPWWPVDVSQPSRGSRVPDGVPAPYGRKDHAPGRQGSLGIPWKVSASLIISVGWGRVVAWLLLRASLAVALPIGALPAVRLVLLLVGHVVGMILGTMGRAELEDTDRVGQTLAWIGIGLNGFRLIVAVPGLFYIILA